ncbi:FecR domain-containing protein [Kordiimonas sp. SCSIO 12603]|uniref:FecR family protein n=1 Tax=Kordiimonas sp. SCSIO 12603 TaxID=2829596 RepID=UPI002103A65F|nr:FecR domain-containing protein [Kordiimonas sp. SCSIO 12603]UTW59317.1 FecR domain-containing protein [Kordiimonas sp. SCSIO 12603]
MANDLKRIDQKLIDEAAEWQAKLAGGALSDAERVRHMEWLLEDPAHTDAFEYVQEAYVGVGQHEQQIRAAFASDLKIPSNQGAVAPKPMNASWVWPKFATGLAAVAALLFVVFFPQTPFYDAPSDPHIYSASTDGLKNVKLMDGSRVTLFAGSRISVEMDDGARNVALESGRAFFDVVSDKDRPFYVNTGERQVRVVGTRFEVLKADGFDRVSVNEGLVSVASQAGEEKTPAILIEPGTVATYASTSDEPILKEVDPTTIGNWTEGVLRFKEQPISEVLAQIQLIYPTIHAVVTAEGDTVFSGTLVVTEPETMLRELAEFTGMELRADSNTYSLNPKQQ